MAQVVIFENALDRNNQLQEMLDNLEELIARKPNKTVTNKIVKALDAQDVSALDALRSGNNVEMHHISHVGSKHNLPFAVDYIQSKNLGDIYADEYEYIVPFALASGSNDFVRNYVAKAPSSYKINDQTFAFYCWSYYAAFGKNIDGLKLLSELGYNPPISDKNKHGWRENALIGACEADDVATFSFLVDEGPGGQPIDINENWGIVSQVIALMPSLNIGQWLIDNKNYAQTEYGVMTCYKCFEQMQVVQKFDWKADDVSKLLAAFIKAEVDLNIIIAKCMEKKITSYVASKFLEYCIKAIESHIPEGERGETAQAIIGNWSLMNLVK